jgi:dTDP-4-dehydrorhamnose 3,5-epimerase
MKEVPCEDLEGVKRVEYLSHLDERGNFKKIFDSSNLSALDSAHTSFSTAITSNLLSGTVRGLHFQLEPKGETKYVVCLSGSLVDVLVDLRPHSPTFMNWSMLRLDSKSGTALLIPPGIAHGYQTLEDDTSVAYLIWGEYSRTHSRRLSVLDEELAITWPLPFTRISKEDSEARSLKETIRELK